MASTNILGTWDDGVFTYNSVDLSDHVVGATLNITRGSAEASAMGDDAAEFKAQRYQATLNVQFLQSFYTGEADVTLAADVLTSANRSIAIKATSSATSATNPDYQFTGFITSWNPFDGNFDEVMTVPLTVQVTGAITRATS